MIYRDRDLTVDKGIKNTWMFSWLETEVLNDRREIPMEKDRQSKRVEMALAAKVAKKIKGPTHQKASEEKANKS